MSAHGDLCFWDTVKEIVLEAVKEACDKGMSFGAPCLAETELAKREFVRLFLV